MSVNEVSILVSYVQRGSIRYIILTEVLPVLFKSSLFVHLVKVNRILPMIFCKWWNFMLNSQQS